jgi:hypothetical protein
LTPEAGEWFKGLSHKEQHRMAAAFGRLEREGPNARRPLVGTIKNSRYHNMKELRSNTTNERALLIFGKDRRGVVLLGGNKTGKWNQWYAEHIPFAEKIYDRHQREGGKEVPWRQGLQRAGRQSAGRAR